MTEPLEQTEMMLSQLADGELGGDEIADVLLMVIDDPDGRERLKSVLRLRQATAGWRNRQPLRPVVLVRQAGRVSHAMRLSRWAGLAAAACFGAVLVLLGFWAADRRPGHGDGAARAATGTVTPEQMRQVASVFALHESVAGPLAWYAADDQSISTAAAEPSTANNRPIAVLLRLVPASAKDAAQTFVIVCREQQDAVIQLPAGNLTAGMRVYLAPRATNGTVDMRYAFAVEEPHDEGLAAAMSGRRRVGLRETSLGQLALGDGLLNVEAAAWPLQETRK
ncbi:MAG: hypothetical protein JXQ75_10530 [Phycisphaerae bacterium]|nr:hypothetical protein [Phycisphaerae bacterium]